MKQIIKPLIWLRVGHFGLAAFFGFGATTTALGADLGGLKVALVEPAVAAKVKAELLSPYRLKVEVDRRGEPKPLIMRIELPASGPKTWPAADVEVRDAHGNALLVQRSGIEWSKLIFTLPVEATTCFVQAVEPPGGWPKSTTDQDRDIRDRAGWGALARQGDQEFANHSAHHYGASGDEDMEREIGGAAQAIWRLTPGKSKLMALNLGGGTRWETTRTLRYYLDQYHQFDASQNSTGMDDSYGNRVENFRRVLGQHLQRGLWCRIHFHSIGEGLSSSEANFRAALDLVKAYGDALWIAGMADIYKYQPERNTAKLTLIESGARQLKFQFTCQTDPALYDQPLTVEIVRSPAMKVDRFEVKDDQGNRLTSRSGPTDGIALLRFDMPPRGAVYAIELTP